MSARLFIISDRTESFYHLASRETVAYWVKECPRSRLNGIVNDGIVGMDLDMVRPGRSGRDSYAFGEADLPPNMATWLSSVGQEGIDNINSLLEIIDDHEKELSRKAEIEELEERLKILRY